ncbi:hypothetical protein G6F64_014688 [Rhizopus arrhizus]|uniref:Uncharacterized protein n=1 Tax=Rhizopus oryzae TaxID=64495 RepID=A0A9P7BJK0_RHIOR|nr:hypothetical protein G6F64_014688 [Rhizopus arrhizus]
MVGDDRSAGQVFHPREKAVSVGRVDVHTVGPGDAVGTGSPRADRTAVDQHVLGPAAALQVDALGVRAADIHGPGIGHSIARPVDGNAMPAGT